MDTVATARYRPVKFDVTRVVMRDGADGTRYMKAEQPLAEYPLRMTDRLVRWAQAAPERTFMARRLKNADGTTGDWRHLSYREALDGARRIGKALIDHGLDVKRPVAILSGNDLEHALLALGCMYAGVPFCPVSPAYSTVSQDYEKLRHVLRTVAPGLVFASDGTRYGKAIAAAVEADIEVVLASGAIGGRRTTPFEQLMAASPTPEVDAAMQATGPDTIVKFLFTSGSTKLPKAVINTHGMWCANQQQTRQSMSVLAEGPPVLVDWLPWNHTFGANATFGIALYNGGTMYIDDGKPTPALIGETLRNLREIAPTLYFNVPTGFEAIAHAMKADAALRANLLSRVRMFFYAGASLAQPVWDALQDAQEQEIGERIVMGTGLGMTESGPFGLFITSPHVKAGHFGVPTPGLELKLVRMNSKTEVRYKGPNITPGYWRNEAVTQECFDDEGYFRSGDAVLWIDEQDVHQGLKFDGRIAEDFKLATGTFVSVGPLRSKIIAAAATYVQDAVITGIDLNEVGALIFPTQAVRNLAGLPPDARTKEVVESAPVQQYFQKLVENLSATATGSASRVARLHLMHEPPSIDTGEITDKGSINQRAVLQHREALVNALHDGTLPFTLQPGKNSS